MTRSDLILGTISTPSHTLSVDSAPFISLSSDWEADGALAVRLATTSSASSVLGVKQSGRGCSDVTFFLHIWVFLQRVLACAASSMQSKRSYRNKESGATWTNRQLILYKCTLYLFIFSLELKRSVTGEHKKPLAWFHSCKVEKKQEGSNHIVHAFVLVKTSTRKIH